jgi:hypothetical protein
VEVNELFPVIINHNEPTALTMNKMGLSTLSSMSDANQTVIGIKQKKILLIFKKFGASVKKK